MSDDTPGVCRDDSRTGPAIGIPVRLSDPTAADADPRVREAETVFTHVVALVRAAGGRPVLVEGGNPDEVAAQLGACDGFVVPGGGDVDPALYGGPSDHVALYDVNPAQDSLDVSVLRHALDTGAPLLGICRGMQLLNVALGGTLHLDLAPGDVTHDAVQGSGQEWGLHEVTLTPGSLVADVFTEPRIPVASGHHQAVDLVGTGLRVTARADDGGIEAVELVADDDATAGWAIGVQWHPEALVPEDGLRLPLFHALVEQAANRSGNCSCGDAARRAS